MYNPYQSYYTPINRPTLPVLPNLVRAETEDRPAGVDYVGMIPYLQAVIKEQEERIKALEEMVNKLIEKESK